MQKNSNRIMRIAYVHDAPVPSHSANAVHVMKMCAALASVGADVTLFCPITNIEGDPYNMYGVTPNFKIRYIKPSKIWRLPFVGSFSTAFITAREVRKQAFDFVFGRSALALYFLRNYKPFIFEAHMLPVNRYRLFAENNIIRSHKMVGHIVITDELRSDYLSTYSFVDPNKMFVLQDAADIAKAVSEDVCPTDPAKKMDIHQKPVIGYLGHLYPGKCMEILSQIAKERPQYDFHVVGGKEEWVNHWKNDISCNNLNNLKFYGYVDNKTIPYYYDLFDICILPFSSQIVIGNFKNANIGRWTSPLKLFEAMSYGKPILTTDLTTIKEVLTDGENCLMESETNISGWCEKLDRLVCDPSLRMKLGASAKTLFGSKYTWDIRAQKIIDILHKGYKL